MHGKGRELSSTFSFLWTFFTQEKTETDTSEQKRTTSSCHIPAFFSFALPVLVFPAHKLEDGSNMVFSGHRLGDGGRINRTGMETTQDKNQRELTLFIPLLSDSSFLIPVPLLLAFFLKRTGQRFRSLGIRVQGLGFESRDEQESGKGRTRDGQDSSLLLFDFTLFRCSLWPLCCCCSQEAYVGMYTNSPELRL